VSVVVAVPDPQPVSLEVLFTQFLEELVQSQTLLEVVVAAGAALNVLKGVQECL